jgi:hypothetical protein
MMTQTRKDYIERNHDQIRQKQREWVRRNPERIKRYAQDRYRRNPGQAIGRARDWELRNRSYVARRKRANYIRRQTILGPRNGQPWTAAEDAIVLRNDISKVEMCYILGRSHGAVTGRRGRLLGKRPPLTAEQKAQRHQAAVERKREWMREYRRQPEQLAKAREWKARNPERVREQKRAWNARNRERIREQARDGYRRRKSDPPRATA